MGVAQKRVTPFPTVTRAEKEQIMSSLADHKARIETLEANDKDFEEILKVLKKIWRALKFGGPTILAFLAGAGWITDEVKAGLLAIFS